MLVTLNKPQLGQKLCSMKHYLKNREKQKEQVTGDLEVDGSSKKEDVTLDTSLHSKKFKIDFPHPILGRDLCTCPDFKRVSFVL